MTEEAVPEGLVDVSQLKALDLPNVRLAGSYATGRATPGSDIDILIGLTEAEWDKVTPRTPPAVLEKIYSILPEEKVSPMLYRLSDVKDMWFFKRGRMGVSGAFVPINDAEMVQGLWNSSIGLEEIPPAVKTEEWKLREAIADTVYGLAHGVKEEDIRKHLTRNPGLKYWLEPEDVDYILGEAKREVAGPRLESIVEYDRRYTLEELREKARQVGLSASGSKKEIAARLIAKGVK